MLTAENVTTLVARYVAHCFVRRQAPHVAQLADILRVAPLQLSRAFLRATDRKLGPFLRTQQVIRARRLLRWQDADLETVARASGFETERSFFRACRRMTGTTPARFRAEACGCRPATPRWHLRGV
ncbi:MAG: helix-turn-helix domain-containing protein [Acidobacteria bacterium]|nr:helix-turn-helix domain-containing protein [Acidobacteriota bacterium]